MEYIKHGADEARRELIDGEYKACFNVYDIEAMILHDLPGSGPALKVCLPRTAVDLVFDKMEEAEQAYQLIKKDWDWWLEQEAANLDDDDEEGDC